MGTGWHPAFRHVDNGIGVSGIDRACPQLSAGPCPRHAPKVLTTPRSAQGMQGQEGPFPCYAVGEP
jgi:hypothetical protein